MSTPENAEALRKQVEGMAARGFRGYPIATVAYYGPTDQFASKVAVGIVNAEGAEPEPMSKWISADLDVRQNSQVLGRVLEFLNSHGVRSMAVTPGIYGCPHEEGTDYPEGGTCPRCPFWAGRDRDDIFRGR